MIVQLHIDVLSRFDWESQKTVLDLKPVTGGQHQLSGTWKPCPGVLLLGLSMVAEYSCGCADRAESVIAENVVAETAIRFR